MQAKIEQVVLKQKDKKIRKETWLGNKEQMNERGRYSTLRVHLELNPTGYIIHAHIDAIYVAIS
jgi:hypothetical protein